MKKIVDFSKIHSLYENWDESMIWSCFQGVMGEAYADNIEDPQSVIIHVHCFAFAAGRPDKKLVQDWYDSRVTGFAVITAREDSWNKVFEEVGKEKCRRVERYAIKKEKGIFDVKRLNAIVEQLADEYEIRPIDETIFQLCMKYEWSADFVRGYGSYDNYSRYGLGFAAFHGEELVAGASSFSSYIGGIEIEVDTKEEYRRRGLASACSAKLILECLKRDLYPSWDAQNKWSVSLAEKLGYHYSHAYTAYEMWKII